MARSTVERKQALRESLKSEKDKWQINKGRNSLYAEYEKILRTANIKSNSLIETQLNKMLDAGLDKVTVYANLKFINLCRSRLTEEGIPLLHAENIIEMLDINMAGINEDDDYIGDIALSYAELAAVIYSTLHNRPTELIDLDSAMAKKFNVLPIQLPAE